MAHLRSPLPRGNGERESAIFQVAGAIVGSSRPARPGELQQVTMRSSPGSGPATKSPDARLGRPLCMPALPGLDRGFVAFTGVPRLCRVPPASTAMSDAANKRITDALGSDDTRDDQGQDGQAS